MPTASEVENKRLIVEKCLIDGFASLANHLQWLWPGNFAADGYHNKSYAENNINFHIGRAFCDNGFFSYFEVPYEVKEKKSLDLLTFNVAQDVLVKIEIKADSGNPKNLCEDLVRLKKNIKIVDHCYSSGLDLSYIKYNFNVFILTTYDEALTKWWYEGTSKKGVYPEGKAAKEWEEMSCAMANAWKDSFVLKQAFTDAGIQYWRAFYAIFNHK